MREARTDDWQEIGATIGAAFAEDPVANWTLGAPAMIREAFTRMARHVYLPRGLAMLEEGKGGTLWLGPGGRKGMAAWPQLGLLARLVLASGPGAIGRALAVEKVMDENRPAFPHYYLFAVGVVPEARGQGLARRLIGETLALADRAGQPCYLENSNPRNESLYRGLGFTPQATFHPAGGGPPLTAMVRQPGAGLSA